MAEIIQSIYNFLIDLLPSSPFQSFIDSVGSFEYLGWLNWFFPVGDCLMVLAAWVGVIGTYWVCSIFLRWVKAIH